MSKKILIVDDEIHIAQLIEQTLEDLEDYGVELFTAANGEEALAVIEEEKPRLVYLDIMMPKMNGYDVCKTVKQEWQLSDIYIVMLTAKGQEVDKRKGKEAGADMYITKPFDPDALCENAMAILGIEQE